jgi:ATP-dependent Clp protease ATP-binding subunit ClpC
MILGLLTLSGGIADGLLRKAGLSVESVEGYLALRRPSELLAKIQDGIPLSTSGLRAIERAEAEAWARQFTYLGIEHLLLGILAEDHGEATDLLSSVPIDRLTMSRTIEEEIQ